MPPGGSGHGLDDVEVAGRPAIRLVSDDAGLAATIVPSLAMLGWSLELGGEDLLGHPGGVREYVERGVVTGIPLLHPWANRLGGRRIAGLEEATVDPGSMLVSLDPHGLPIHGLHLMDEGWAIVRREAAAGGAGVTGSLDLGAHAELMAAFPFPHEIAVAYDLTGDTLTVTTSLRATGAVAVPVSFGWHPYLRIPGVPREEWLVGMPVRRRAILDERQLPTGEREDVRIPDGPLGERTYDDEFPVLEAPAVFTLRGGGVRLEVAFGAGYPVAQVYAPARPEVIAFEPMTAETNALVTGDGLRRVPPGESFDATFSVRAARD